MKFRKKAAAIVLLFVALVLLNFIAYNLPLRADFTANHIYTLSAGTKALIAKIEEPVTLDFYFSRQNTSVPIELKDYADRVLVTLQQYQRIARGKIILNVVDPEPDTPQEDQATQAGIQPQRTDVGAEPFYFGLVATEADKTKAIAALTPDREQFLEYDISELLYNVGQVDKKKLGLITSLPLQGSEGNPMSGQQGTDPQYVISSWEDTFDIVPVDATATTLPADLDALAVVQPENLTPGLQFAIDQFLLAGKPVFIAVDPSSQYFKAQGGQMAMYGGTPPNVSSDLPTLFSGWGIDYNPQKVVGDNDSATQVQLRDGSLARYPVWLSLNRSDVDPEALPTAELNSLLFVEAGSVSLAPTSTLTFTPLVQTSPQAGEIDASALQFAQPDDIAKQIVPTGRKTIAALITGTFHTAFPDGPPKDDSSAAKGSAAAKPVHFLKQSTGKSTLLVVADTDWLLDDFSLRKINLLGTNAAEPLNDNLDFAANALDYLSGSDDLLSIRGKGASLRPFTRVQKMEDAANLKYQDELSALETQLSSVQSKISDLQGKQGQGTRLVATPEITKAIQDFQAQEVRLRARRRALNLALKQGINQLKYTLLAINLLFTPLIVCAFGIWYSRARRAA